MFQRICYNIAIGTGAAVALVFGGLLILTAVEWRECRQFSTDLGLDVEWSAANGCWVPAFDRYLHTIDMGDDE